MSAVEQRLVLRFLGSELLMVLRRRRNQLILAALAIIPVLIGVAVKVTGSGNATGLIGGISNNGAFVAFTALVVVIPVFLPMAVAIVVGESVAGEAGLGTLRYLLAVPVGRSRVLLVKFIAVCLWCLVIALIVAVAGLAIGFSLFPVGDVTLLSGTQVSLFNAVVRLVVMVGYAAVMMIAVAAVGLFLSTLTEVPIAAMAATLAVAITMQVLEAVPQLHSIHGLLITHYVLNFADMIRDPVEYSAMVKGLAVAAAYLAIFYSLAWARFTTKDVTS